MSNNNQPPRRQEQLYINASLDMMLSALAASSNTLINPPAYNDSNNSSAPRHATHHALRNAISAFRNNPSGNNVPHRIRSEGMMRPFELLNDECSEPDEASNQIGSASAAMQRALLRRSALRDHRAGRQQYRMSHYFADSASRNSAISMHPQFRTKAVCDLFCSHCKSHLCRRGMKAILLGNAQVELYSTDVPPDGISAVNSEYTTGNCDCKIKDTACHTCGNIVGYRVTKPCLKCLDSCNNGHFWMLLSDAIYSKERINPTSKAILQWAELCSTAVGPSAAIKDKGIGTSCLR